MIRIATATYEDLAYIASWLCQADREELAVTRDPDDYIALADAAYASALHKVALDPAGTPIFAFGATPSARDAAHVWGFKTETGICAGRAVTRYLLQDLIPSLRAAGVTRASCYVHENNQFSRRWLAHLGFRPKATPGEIGTPLIVYERDDTLPARG